MDLFETTEFDTDAGDHVRILKMPKGKIMLHFTKASGVESEVLLSHDETHIFFDAMETKLRPLSVKDW